MTIFKTKSTLQEIAEKEIQLTARRRSAQVALVLARAAAGEAAITGEAESEIQEIVRLSAQIHSADRAIELVRERRAPAIMSEYGEKAQQIRDTAAGKKRELASLQAKTGKLLRELSALEGITYTPALLEAEAPAAGIVPGMMGSGYLVPKSAALRDEIVSLETQAAEIESRQVPNVGNFDAGATSDEEVVAGVLAHRSHVPTAEAVIDWLADCSKDRRLRGEGFADRQRRVVVAWNSGVIDTAASYIHCPDFATPISITLTGHRGKRTDPVQTGVRFDPQGAIFRAPQAETPRASRFGLAAA